MFDLEQAIVDWRKQMLTAGIQTPVPMEELENHLHEEIQELITSGMESRAAFALAAEKIGPAKALNQEFKKNPGTLSFSFRRFATIPGVLAALWFAGCLTDLIAVSRWFVLPQDPHHHNVPLGLLNLLVLVPGCAGCVLLFIGSKLGVRIVRSIALLYLIAGLAQSIPNLGQSIDWRIWCATIAAFSLFTIWQLHRPHKQTATA